VAPPWEVPPRIECLACNPRSHTGGGSCLSAFRDGGGDVEPSGLPSTYLAGLLKSRRNVSQDSARYPKGLTTRSERARGTHCAGLMWGGQTYHLDSTILRCPLPLHYLGIEWMTARFSEQGHSIGSGRCRDPRGPSTAEGLSRFPASRAGRAAALAGLAHVERYPTDDLSFEPHQVVEHHRFRGRELHWHGVTRPIVLTSAC